MSASDSVSRDSSGDGDQNDEEESGSVDPGQNSFASHEREPFLIGGIFNAPGSSPGNKKKRQSTQEHSPKESPYSFKFSDIDNEDRVKKLKKQC